MMQISAIELQMWIHIHIRGPHPHPHPEVPNPKIPEVQSFFFAKDVFSFFHIFFEITNFTGKLDPEKVGMPPTIGDFAPFSPFFR